MAEAKTSGIDAAETERAGKTGSPSRPASQPGNGIECFGILTQFNYKIKKKKFEIKKKKKY